MKYANAAKIFPQSLLDEMRKHFPEGLLWAPRRDGHRLERNDHIVLLVENGEPVEEVAALAQLSPRHIYRLVRERRQKPGCPTAADGGPHADRQPPDNPESENAPAVSSIKNVKGDDAQ